MGKLHSEVVVKYKVNGRWIDVELCWQGKEPAHDNDRFYDFYDEHGTLLNEGSPWHDDENGVPSFEDVTKFLGG
tara:strand:+ start:874 stop:1095 length:222 start_codon:yes stop_codon:yes gene_type:complete